MGQTLRILSANLWNGAADVDAFVDLVMGLAVDVVAVQEVTLEHAEVLSRVMSHGQFEPGRGRRGGMGIAMRGPAEMSRVPMQGQDAHLALLHPRDWSQLDEPLEILNVHLTAPHDLVRVPMLERPRQVRALEQHFRSSPSQHRVAVGDYNSTPLWPAYRRIRSHLTDAAVAVAERTGRSPERTWGPWHDSPRLLRIDHGFVSGPSVESFRVVTVDGSDHCAIVMDVASGNAGRDGRGEGLGEGLGEG